MVGGTIRRKVIHRESFRASVLHLSEIQAVLQSIAAKKSVLTTPSLLSSATRELCLSLWQYFRATADPSIRESQLSARPWMAAGGFQFGLEEIADLAK